MCGMHSDDVDWCKSSDQAARDELWSAWWSSVRSSGRVQRSRPDAYVALCSHQEAAFNTFLKEHPHTTKSDIFRHFDALIASSNL